MQKEYHCLLSLDGQEELCLGPKFYSTCLFVHVEMLCKNCRGIALKESRMLCVVADL